MYQLGKVLNMKAVQWQMLGCVAFLGAVLLVVTHFAVNVTLTISEAGLIVSCYVIFGSLFAGFVGGFIASFFETDEA